MAFCSSCGTQLKEGAKFCAACGASVLAEASASEKAAVPVADTPPAAAQSKSAAAEVSARRFASLKKPSKRAIIIAAAAVVVIAGGVIFAVMSGTGLETGTGLGIEKSSAASLPSLLGGQNYAGTNAASYFCEATAKINVDGEDIEYWLFNTYKNDNGSSNVLKIVFKKILEKLQEDGLSVSFYHDAMQHISPNADLHENVKKMMNKEIDGNTHDVSICLLNGSLIVNNYDIQNKTFDTIIIPLIKMIKSYTGTLAEIGKLLADKNSPPTFIFFDGDSMFSTVAPPTEQISNDYPPDYIYRVVGRSGGGAWGWDLQQIETEIEWVSTLTQIVDGVKKNENIMQIVHKNNDCYIKVWE